MSFFGKDMVDPRPTAADFPRRMWEYEDIPREYRANLRNCIRGELDYERLIFVPQSRYRREQHEYMLTRSPHHLVYLEREPDGSVKTIRIRKEQICCVCVKENLLKGSYVVYWTNNSVTQHIEIMFNTSRKELFQPFLNWMLNADEMLNVHTLSKQRERPQALKKMQLALYNYSEELFRFGGTRGSWRWWNVQWRGFFGRIRDGQSACLLSEMDQGQTVIWFRDTAVDIWYLFQGKAQAQILNESGKTNIRIYAGKEEAGAVTNLAAD